MANEHEEKLRDLVKKVPVHEDMHWLYFGYGEGWGDKCKRCFEELESGNHVNKDWINCWKFEIWADNVTDITATLNYLLEEADRDPTLHGKLLKRAMPMYEPQGERIASCKSHSIPEEAKPDSYLNGELLADRIFLIYSQTIEERDRRMGKIIGDLKALGLYKKDLAPYRRGCVQPHENALGPWENWYDLERDLETNLENLIHKKILN